MAKGDLLASLGAMRGGPMGGPMGSIMAGPLGQMFQGGRLQRPPMNVGPDPNRLGGEMRQPMQPPGFNVAPPIGQSPNRPWGGFRAPDDNPIIRGPGGKEFKFPKLPWAGEKPEKNMGSVEKRQRAQFPGMDWPDVRYFNDPNRIHTMNTGPRRSIWNGKPLSPNFTGIE